MVGMPAFLSAAACSGTSRRARIPPCTLGCRVFTRPSSISGKPVWSATSVTFRPASLRSFAVPPVEMRLTPRPARPRANSTSPVLSETLSSACLITAIPGRLHLLLDAVHPHLLAQRIAVDAEHLGGVGLVAAHAGQYAFQQRLLDAVYDHVVDRAGFFPVQVAKIAVDRLAHHARHFILVHHSAGSST